MSTDYRLAGPLAARLVGTVLVVAALVVLVTTVAVAATGGPGWVLLAVGLGAVVVTLAAALVVRRRPLLHLDEVGYRVRWVRGAGVAEARWDAVADAVTADARGIDCVVLRLVDGRTTSIPVTAVDADRDDLVRVVRDHLTRGSGLRPL